MQATAAPSQLDWPRPRKEPTAPSRAAIVFATLQAVVVVAFLAQTAIEPSRINLVAAALVLLSSTLTLQYLRLTRAFNALPFSSFALLGLCVTTQYGALITQSLAWTPVSASLRDPLMTFGLLAMFQAIAVLAHALCRRLGATRALRRAVARNVLTPIGVFDVPSPGNLWLLGAVGFAALLTAGSVDATGSVPLKILDGCRFLAWAPFIIPLLHRRHGDDYCDMRAQGIALGVYVVLVFGLGIAVNIRSVMFAGITTAALMFLLMALRDMRPSHPKRLWRLAPLFLLAGLAINYAADLAIAMVVAREQRGSIDPVTMLQQTFQTLFDRNVIEIYKELPALAAKTDLYDEYYIANPILARFVETKFHDNMFFLIQGLQAKELVELRTHAVDSLWATLPDPVARRLGVQVDKIGLQHSVGDYFDYLRYGADLGGYKTGSLFAHGLALFGKLFVPLYLVLCMCMYLAWDSLSYEGDGDKDGGEGGEVWMAPLAMLSGWWMFLGGLGSDSVLSIPIFLTRSLPQAVLLYVILYWASRALFSPYLSRRRVAVRPAAAAAAAWRLRS